MNTVIDAVGYFLHQSATTAFTYQIAAAQYSSTGSLDASFNPSSATRGQIATAFRTSTGTVLNGWGQAVAALDATHFLVAGGAVATTGAFNLAIAKYDPPLPSGDVPTPPAAPLPVAPTLPVAPLFLVQTGAIGSELFQVLVRADIVVPVRWAAISYNSFAGNGTTPRMYDTAFLVSENSYESSSASGGGFDWRETDFDPGDGEPELPGDDRVFVYRKPVMCGPGIARIGTSISRGSSRIWPVLGMMMMGQDVTAEARLVRADSDDRTSRDAYFEQSASEEDAPATTDRRDRNESAAE